MATTVTITDFEENLHGLISKVLTGQEVICIDAKRNDKQTCSLIKTNLLLEILKIYSFEPKIYFDKETKTYNIHLDEIRLYAYADTLEEATKQIMDLAVDYARDYIDRLELFLNVPDRAAQYPFILRLTHCRHRNEVKRLLFGN